MKKIIIFIGLIFITICSFGQMKITSNNVIFRESPEANGNKIDTIQKNAVIYSSAGYSRV